MGQIFDIQRFSTHDGPGGRTTVFFEGCPLRCFWCQNPEGLSPQAQLELVARRGGALINANVLDSGMIRDASRHPDKYPDLVVRVTGFSAYFASLSPEFRQLVHDRIVSMADEQ